MLKNQLTRLSLTSYYGWETLFSERLYLNYARNCGMNIRIARYHNIFYEEGTWIGGQGKFPAALRRKLARAEDEGNIEIWVDGEQTKSFLYIDECLDATLRPICSDVMGLVDIGLEKMVMNNELARIIMQIDEKNLI